MNPTPYILWGSMGTAQVVFLVVATLIPAVGTEAWAPLLIVPALGVAGLSAAARFMPAFLLMPPQTRAIVRWALAEAAGIFGLLAYLESGVPTYQYGCAFFGFAAWIYAFPSDAASWPVQNR